MSWIKFKDQKPPKGVIVETKVVGTDGKDHNVQRMIYDRNLWWHEDKSTYVYYVPSHWKYIQ